MKSIKFLSIVIFVMVAASCTNQKYVSSETDDLYYSSSDRFASSKNEFSVVEETDASNYATQDDYKKESNGYFFKGSSAQQTDQNPNAANAYANNSQQAPPSEFEESRESTSTDGATVNNYYGNTTVYGNDYYDTDYAARMRRFNSGYAPGYSYFDPFFVDPYWNYGWSAWNPYQMGGWNVGWNSWSGWNVGYGFGYSPFYGNAWGAGGLWGNNCWNAWNCNRFGFGNPYGWGGNYWGWGGNNWGWGGNAFNNGYYNGFYDGFYANNDRRNSGRGTFNGRRDLSNNTGIVGSNRNDGNPNSTTRNRSASSTQSEKNGLSSSPNGTDVRKSERMASSSSIYQVSPAKSPNNTIRNEVTKSELVNPNSKTSSARYESNRTQPAVNTRTKYEASTLSRAESASRRYQAPVRSSNVSSTPAPSRNSNAVKGTERQSTSPVRSTSPNVRSSSGKSYNTTTPARSSSERYYQQNQTRTAPSNTQTRRYSNPQRTSPNVAPSRSSSQSNSVRGGNSSRSNFSAPSGQSSSGRMSAPSRSSSPSVRSSSPSSSPRSSSPNRGGGRR